MKQESHIRSVLKAVTWRILATSTTFLLAYFIFSSAECEDVLEKSTIVAGLEFFIKILIYYLHERAWQKMPRGSVRKIFSSKKG